jgi:hypothetical protein
MVNVLGAGGVDQVVASMRSWVQIPVPPKQKQNNIYMYMYIYVCSYICIYIHICIYISLYSYWFVCILISYLFWHEKDFFIHINFQFHCCWLITCIFKTPVYENHLYISECSTGFLCLKWNPSGLYYHKPCHKGTYFFILTFTSKKAILQNLISNAIGQSFLCFCFHYSKNIFILFLYVRSYAYNFWVYIFTSETMNSN